MAAPVPNASSSRMPIKRSFAEYGGAPITDDSNTPSTSSAAQRAHQATPIHARRHKRMRSANGSVISNTGQPSFLHSVSMPDQVSQQQQQADPPIPSGNEMDWSFQNVDFDFDHSVPNRETNDSPLREMSFAFSTELQPYTRAHAPTLLMPPSESSFHFGEATYVPTRYPSPIPMSNRYQHSNPLFNPQSDPFQSDDLQQPQWPYGPIPNTNMLQPNEFSSRRIMTNSHHQEPNGAFDSSSAQPSNVPPSPISPDGVSYFPNLLSYPSIPSPPLDLGYNTIPRTRMPRTELSTSNQGPFEQWHQPLPLPQLQMHHSRDLPSYTRPLHLSSRPRPPPPAPMPSVSLRQQPPPSMHNRNARVEAWRNTVPVEPTSPSGPVASATDSPTIPQWPPASLIDDIGGRLLIPPPYPGFQHPSHTHHHYHHHIHHSPPNGSGPDALPLPRIPRRRHRVARLGEHADGLYGMEYTGGPPEPRERLVSTLRSLHQAMNPRSWVRRRDRIRAIGDFVLDEDFDDSYEALLALTQQVGPVKRGCASEAVDKLPSGSYADFSTPAPGDGNGKGKVKGDDGSCAICLEDYMESDICTKLPKCSHFYHKICIAQWLKGAKTCPVCREPVEEKGRSRFTSPEVESLSEATQVPRIMPLSLSRSTALGRSMDENISPIERAMRDGRGLMAARRRAAAATSPFNWDDDEDIDIVVAPQPQGGLFYPPLPEPRLNTSLPRTATPWELHRPSITRPRSSAMENVGPAPVVMPAPVAGPSRLRSLRRRRAAQEEPSTFNLNPPE